MATDPQRELTAPWGRRAAEMAAVFMIGDGLLGLTQPRRHVDLWKDKALGAELAVAPFVDRPGRRRLYALAQVAAGLWLASRQRPDQRPVSPGRSIDQKRGPSRPTRHSPVTAKPTRA